MSASVLAFEDRSDLIGAFAPRRGVYRDVAGRSAVNNIRLEVKASNENTKEARSRAVARAADARSRGQRGRDRSAQADVDRTVIDPRGGILASEHFRVSGEGHRELEVWARQFGQIARWGIEGSASWGRHTAVFLIDRGWVDSIGRRNAR
ncbi:MAG: hypothetical protein ABI323_02105 [Solirubrobacteraceae bacterium]